MINADCTTIELLANFRQVLAERLTRLRKSRDWTQYDLAAAARISVDALRGYEQQKRWPDPEIIEALGRALEVKPIELLVMPEELRPKSPEQALEVLSEFVKKNLSKP